MKQYVDDYKGYEIDYHPDIEDCYAYVWYKGEIVYRASSYDAACEWIDKQ